MNSYNNNNRRNNNNNNNQRRNNRGGNKNRTAVRRYDDENVSPQQKRHFVNKRDTHMTRGKDMRANGDRVQAENEFQHAEHYTRMINIADAQQVKYEEKKAAEKAEREKNNPRKTEATSSDEKPVASEGNAEQKDENAEASEEKVAKKPTRTRKPRKAPVKNTEAAEAEKPTEKAVEKPAAIAELPFMQDPKSE